MDNRFSYQDLDQEVNIPDLKKSMNDDNLWGIIDEKKGGIIAYAIGEEHADFISASLNSLYNGLE